MLKHLYTWNMEIPCSAHPYTNPIILDLREIVEELTLQEKGEIIVTQPRSEYLKKQYSGHCNCVYYMLNEYILYTSSSF